MVLAEDVFLSEASSLFVAATQYTETEYLTSDDVMRLLSQLGRRFGLQPFPDEALVCWEQLMSESASVSSTNRSTSIDRQGVSMTLFLLLVREQVWPTVWDSMASSFAAPEAEPEAAAQSTDTLDTTESIPALGAVSANVVQRAVRSLFYTNDNSGVGVLTLAELSKTLSQLWHRLGESSESLLLLRAQPYSTSGSGGLEDLQATLDDCYGCTMTSQLGHSLSLLGHEEIERIPISVVMAVLGVDPWLSLLPAGAHEQLALREEPVAADEQPVAADEQPVAIEALDAQEATKAKLKPSGPEPMSGIGEWLSSLGLGKYLGKFEAAGLSTLGRVVLVDMQSYSDLEAIAVRNRKHQAVILKAVAEASIGWEEHYPEWLPTTEDVKDQEAAQQSEQQSECAEEDEENSFLQPKWNYSTAQPPLPPNQAPKQMSTLPRTWPQRSPGRASFSAPSQPSNNGVALTQLSPNPRKDPQVQTKIMANLRTSAVAAHDFAMKRTAAWENPQVPRVVEGSEGFDGEAVVWHRDRSRKEQSRWNSPLKKTPVRQPQFSNGPVVRNVYGQSRAELKPEVDHKLIADLHRREARQYNSARIFTPTNRESPVATLMVEQFK